MGLVSNSQNHGSISNLASLGSSKCSRQSKIAWNVYKYLSPQWISTPPFTWDAFNDILSELRQEDCWCQSKFRVSLVCNRPHLRLCSSAYVAGHSSLCWSFSMQFRLSKISNNSNLMILQCRVKIVLGPLNVKNDKLPSRLSTFKDHFSQTHAYEYISFENYPFYGLSLWHWFFGLDCASIHNVCTNGL